MPGADVTIVIKKAPSVFTPGRVLFDADVVAAPHISSILRHVTFDENNLAGSLETHE